MIFSRKLPILIIIFLSAAVSLRSDFASKFENAKSYFREGLTLFNKMNYLASAEYFRKAVSVYPDYHNASEYLARAYRLSGYSEEALHEWEKLYDISGSPAVKNKVEILNYLAVSDFSEREFADEFSMVRTMKSSEIPGGRFPYPMDIVCDSNKNVYVTSFTSGKIVKFDLNGNVEKVHSSIFGGKIYGIDCYGSRIIYTDFKSDKAAVVDLNFKTIMKIGTSGSGESEFHGPQGCAFDKSGDFYIVDTGNDRIQKFAKDGKFIFSFGTSGEYEGQLNSPSDIAVLENNLFITDTGNKRIVVFDKSGNFISNIQKDEFDTLKGISAFGSNLAVSDNKNGIIFYNPSTGETKVIKEYSEEKYFSRLNSLTFDRDGVMYALDHGRESVEVMLPLRKKFSNLDVEITSIDTTKFPAVAVFMSVRNRDGSPAFGLKKNNFSIKEDNAGIKSFYVDYFPEMRKKTRVVLCLDRSSGMENYHQETIWISDLFLSELKKNDRVKMVSFSSDSEISNNFDWSRLRMLRAAKEKNYQDGRNIGKALYNAIDDLVSEDSRRAVILVTDGQVSDDSFSQYGVSRIINYARNHFVPVYIISYADPAQELVSISTATGGSVISAKKPDLVKKLYYDIKNSEEYRYALVYNTYKTSSKFKNWWSDIRINVETNGQSGTEWGGYFVP